MIMKYVLSNLQIILQKSKTIWNKNTEEHRLIVIVSCRGDVVYVGCSCNIVFWEKELDDGDKGNEHGGLDGGLNRKRA